MAGVCGLARAVRQYDPERGFAFSTFAVPLIRSAIQRDPLVGSYRRKTKGHSSRFGAVSLETTTERVSHDDSHTYSPERQIPLDHDPIQDAVDAMCSEEAMRSVVSLAVEEACLNDNQRYVFLQRVLDGDTFTAIAEDLGFSSTYPAVLFHKVCRETRKALWNQEQRGGPSVDEVRHCLGGRAADFPTYHPRHKQAPDPAPKRMTPKDWTLTRLAEEAEVHKKAEERKLWSEWIERFQDDPFWSNGLQTPWGEESSFRMKLAGPGSSSLRTAWWDVTYWSGGCWKSLGRVLESWDGSCRVMVHDGRRTERSDFIEGESYQGTAAASLALCLGSGFLAEEMRSWLASTRTPED